MNEIKDKISGAFDLLFVFGRGIDKFSGTKKEVVQSLMIWAVAFCGGLAFAPFYPPKGMETGYSTEQILLIVTLQMIASFVLSNALVFAIAMAIRKQDKFWLFFSASCWVGIVASVITVPLMLIAVFGIVERAEMDKVLVLVTCYLYIVTACIAWRAFRMPWQIAGLMAIVSLFANEQTWKFFLAVQGIPEPW